MDVNILRSILIFNSVIIESISLLIAYMKPYLSTVLSRCFYYGKVNEKTHHPIIEKIEISKKSFGHAYLFTEPTVFILFCLALNKYLYNGDIPTSLLSLLDTLVGASRKPLVSAESTILAIVMFSIHCWKRVYETYYVCVFSNQKINIFHYILTIVHYSILILCLVGESEGFVKGSHSSFSLRKLTTMQLICALIFLWSTYTQLRMNFILAGLRKNQHGDVKYWYLMLFAILWQASTFHYITIFVIINQIECAIVSDHWHRNTFKNYPKERKILIPYVW